MQIFHRIKSFADVATGTAKVEFSDVSSQAKDMIETIDNACNTDRTLEGIRRQKL